MKITLYGLKQITEINKKPIDDLDKLLFSVCVAFNKTEYQLDNTKSRKVTMMIAKVHRYFENEMACNPVKRIGPYVINYNPEQLTFGQYVELCYYLQQPLINSAASVLASITHLPFVSNNSGKHREKTAYFLKQDAKQCIACAKAFIENFTRFNGNYKNLFEKKSDDDAPVQSVTGEAFLKKFGWIYSATCIKAHEGVTMEEVFKMPVRQALGDLIYIKEKGKFDELQIKMSKNGR